MAVKWTPYADLMIQNANIYTADTTIPKILAGNYAFPVIPNGYVAVKDGKIIEVGAGTNPALVGETTEVVDASGKTLIPGLMDSHMHAMFAGLDLKNVALEGCRCMDEMDALLKERVAQVPAGTWIKGAAWNELNWNDGKKPSRASPTSLS